MADTGLPFLVRWPGRIEAGTKSDQTICLVDFLATCAEIVGAKLPDNAGEDSVSLLPALLGKADRPLHEAVVHHSINGSFSIRQGNWKLETVLQFRRLGARRDPILPTPGNCRRWQLYDLSQDVAEKDKRAGRASRGGGAVDPAFGKIRRGWVAAPQGPAAERCGHRTVEGSGGPSAEDCQVRSQSSEIRLVFLPSS